MKHCISLRALFLLLSVMVVVMALASLPAAAQETTPAAPSVAAAASSSATPAPYKPAAAAFATPKPAAANSSEGPDPDRHWEVEVHGGYMLAVNPTSGTSNLPNPGLPFSTFIGVNDSRAISSWYFGDGALLYNQMVADTQATLFPLVNSITPWDAVLRSSVVRRQDGGTVGGRVSYDFNRRINAELNFDYNMGDLAFTRGALLNTQATSDSFVAAFTELISPPFCGFCTGTVVTSTPTVINHQGAAFEFTGGVNVNWWTSGRFIPYVSVGIGVLHTTGDVPAINLTGHYQTNVGTLISETDSATLLTQVDANTLTGYVGVGGKYYVTPHWGFRFDVRDHISANTISNLVSASPSVVTVTPGTCFTQTFPAHRVEFCNDPTLGFKTSLSGPAISNFHSFSGSGALHQVSVTAGLFFRF